MTPQYKIDAISAIFLNGYKVACKFERFHGGVLGAFEGVIPEYRVYIVNVMSLMLYPEPALSVRCEGAHKPFVNAYS